MSETDPFLAQSRDASSSEDLTSSMLPSHVESDTHGLRSPRRASGRSAPGGSLLAAALAGAAHLGLLKTAPEALGAPAHDNLVPASHSCGTARVYF